MELEENLRKQALLPFLGQSLNFLINNSSLEEGPFRMAAWYPVWWISKIRPNDVDWAIRSVIIISYGFLIDQILCDVYFMKICQQENITIME